MVQLASETDQRPNRIRSRGAIGDYAIIGDCRTAALVSLHGSIDWMCLPHFSGASVFAALLDQERGGRFAICPVGHFQSTRRYLGATAVLETTFKTITGSARLIDAMPIVEDSETLRPLREVLRILEGIEGEVSFDVRWEPRPNYARSSASIRSRGALGWSCTWSDELFLLHSEAALDLRAQEAAVVGRIRVKAGTQCRFSLGYAKADIGVISPLGSQADDRLRSTLEWWQRWSSQCAYNGPYSDAVIRSAITLKLMTFALSGAVVAAPTTSLPEAIGADRNCSFWAIDNLAARGDVDAAMQAFEHILTFSNDVGLFAEEMDPDTGEALGNFPQAFTHVGLVNGAMALAAALREPLR